MKTASTSATSTDLGNIVQNPTIFAIQFGDKRVRNVFGCDAEDVRIVEKVLMVFAGRQRCTALEHFQVLMVGGGGAADRWLHGFHHMMSEEPIDLL
ncbi:hypothetical protein [Ensifer sp.]|jgi:hypothetical protein|uniref:hypothetical protein n=1 Tax=Ensifer sp. TaxID=1872086 RepID=UPI002E133106|nr:hypothetical protein [Ensifer sp.]